jgi:sulfite exporter TauE/SafE
MTEYFGLFMLGLLGTAHCAGMCGPLVAAFPGLSGRFAAHLFYHAGRVCTYVAIGAIMGAAGTALAGLTAIQDRSLFVRGLAAVQLGAAVGLGWLGLVRVGWLAEPHWFQAITPQRIPGFGTVVAGTAHRRWAAAHFVLGAMFGFLPCSLSYAAFAQAFGTGSVGGGAAAALAFGLGTLPGLLLLGTGVTAFVRRRSVGFDLLAGVIMILMAVDLAVRSLRAF